MTKQNSFKNNYHTSEFHLKYDITLSDLVQLIPPYKIFSLQTYQIEVNSEENFTFGTELYTIKIPKSQDNEKRVLYFSLLCYIFQICKSPDAQTYQQTFVQFFLNKIQLILPYKGYPRLAHQKSAPLMTTNQIKACFVKFIKLLKQRQKNPKLVLQELMTLPQIDFIFMSIMQMYIKKKNFRLQTEIQRIEKDFNIKIKVLQNGYILNNELQIQRKISDQRWDKFFIRKIDINKSKLPTSLKRKQTTQSVGEIDQEFAQSNQNINDFLHFPELINAKFAISCQSSQVQKFHVQVSNEQADFILQQKKEIKPFVKKQNITAFGHFINHADKALKRQKRTSFFNQNLNHYNLVKNSQKSMKREKMKTQSSADVQLSMSQPTHFHFKPWSPPNHAQSRKKTLVLNQNLEISKSSKTLQEKALQRKALETKALKYSFQTSCTRWQQRRQSQFIDFLSIKAPKKRQTLQRIISILTKRAPKCADMSIDMPIQSSSL